MDFFRRDRARQKAIPPGDIVTVKDTGNFLARSCGDPKSQIRVRILTWKDEEINDDWWRRM
ncbi:MAG: hypothetical protein U0694_11390 [Anaerolineae bacterium]